MTWLVGVEACAECGHVETIVVRLERVDGSARDCEGGCGERVTVPVWWNCDQQWPAIAALVAFAEAREQRGLSVRTRTPLQ